MRGSSHLAQKHVA